MPNCFSCSKRILLHESVPREIKAGRTGSNTSVRFSSRSTSLGGGSGRSIYKTVYFCKECAEKNPVKSNNKYIALFVLLAVIAYIFWPGSKETKTTSYWENKEVTASPSSVADPGKIEVVTNSSSVNNRLDESKNQVTETIDYSKSGLETVEETKILKNDDYLPEGDISKESPPYDKDSSADDEFPKTSSDSVDASTPNEMGANRIEKVTPCIIPGHC